MDIAIARQGQELLITLRGRLDTVTTPQTSEKLKDIMGSGDRCTLELGELDYISSAGLRLLLLLHKRAAAFGGCLRLRNVQPGVKDILEMTGFTNFLSLE